jgi:hypothetical protein
VIPPRDAEADAIRVLVELHLEGPDEWLPEHYDTAEVAARRVAEWLGRAGRSPRKAPKALPAESPKRKAERPLRDAVRAEVKARDQGCVGPRRGLPKVCGTLPDRYDTEVHEVESRGTRPGSHLLAECAVELCPVHHSYCTSAKGEALKLVRRVGLVVRPST